MNRSSPKAAAEKRRALRFDKVFPVWVASTEYGDLQGIARNISAGGMFIETSDPLPLGATVRVHFSVEGSAAEIIACGEVKNHYFFNFVDRTCGPRSIAGMGVRFTGFIDDGAQSLEQSLTGCRVLH